MSDYTQMSNVPPRENAGKTRTIREVIESGELPRGLDTPILGVLPITADGCVACPGSLVSCPRGHEATSRVHNGTAFCTEGNCWDEGCQSDHASGTTHNISQCYSTKAAASAAKGEK